MARRKKQVKKIKQKKSKAKLTKAYKKTEQEVQSLLEEVTNSARSLEIDSDAGSVDFFCKTVSDKYLTHILQKEEVDDDEEEEEEAQSDLASIQSENRTAESTYLQIEVLEEPIVKRIDKQIHATNMENLLYQPANQLNPYINLPTDMQVVSKDLVRLLNRYYEETHNVSKEFILALANNELQTTDKSRYRTFCAKEFTTIFCKAQPQLVQIPVRRLLKLHLKHLRFTEHPELAQEHRFAYACEKAYDKYAQHKREQICEDLNLKLRQERAVLQQILQQDEMNDEQGKEVIKQMLMVRKLREELLAAELERKLLLREVIEKWLLLKKIRKSQGQQFSLFKLRVNIKETNSFNWKQRYKKDLEEIYVEQLQEYYAEQRKWKKLKNKAKSLNSKPEKPKLKEIAHELKEQYKSLFDEPNIEIQRCDVGYEQLDIKMQKIRTFFAKIYLDAQFVSSSRNYRLEPDFSCHMDETFGVLLERHMPKQIKVTVNFYF